MSGAGAASPPPTPTTIFHFFLLLFLLPPPTHGLNVTHLTALLSGHPDLSVFTSLLLSSAALYELSHRTSLTLLAVPNSLLPPSAAAAALRYHVLLRFLTSSDLRQTPPAGTLIPTLLQTPLNLTFNPSNGVVSFQPPISSNPNFPSSANSAIVLSFVTSIPHTLSIFSVSALIYPADSQTPPPPAGIDITKALIGGHIFNVAASMLNASGVLQDLEKSETGAGITLFIPTDDAFAGLPPEFDLKPLPAEKKALVLKFHVLHSYYTLGSLQSIVNPVEPTMATEENGAGTFTLNISKVNGSVSLDSGLDLAVISQTVFDQNPVAIFGISNVLLPKEIFGGVKESAVVVEMRNDSNGGGGYSAALPPEIKGEIRSDAGGGAKQGFLTLFCTAGLLLLLYLWSSDLSPLLL